MFPLSKLYTIFLHYHLSFLSNMVSISMKNNFDTIVQTLTEDSKPWMYYTYTVELNNGESKTMIFKKDMTPEEARPKAVELFGEDIKNIIPQGLKNHFSHWKRHNDIRRSAEQEYEHEDKIGGVSRERQDFARRNPRYARRSGF